MTICTILAEKPSQALAYASSFESMEKKNGYFIVKDKILPEKTFITFGYGHLVELASPGHYSEEWERWSLDNLPIFPSSYKFVVPEDKEKQFSIVEELLKKSNVIVVATDSDREGENIAWSIIHKADAYSENKIFKRLWINSLEKETIREGFKNLRNGEDFIPLYHEARARQISDWLIGMNGSPLYSLCLQKKGINEGAFSLGRVQTPTLYMIFKRQIEIERFKKEPYFELESNITAEHGAFKAVLSPLQRFNTQDEARVFLREKQALEGVQKGRIINVEKNKKKTSSPSLFSLSSLQSKINQQYKASASDTLKAVQALYEARLLTYPRTDTPYITENEFNYLKSNLNLYQSFLGIEINSPQLEAQKRYVNNDRVQEHHAIILTRQIPSKETFDKLPELQKKVYMLVANTTIAMFMPDYEYEETVIETKVGELLFKSKGQLPLIFGWKQLFKGIKEEDKETEPVLPSVHEGEIVEINVSLIEKETKPPKPYTEGTLITAMKTAGKTVDDEQAQELLKEIEGIGTEATRANIIDTLKNKKYIVSQKNQLVVTEKGKILCRAVEGQPLLTSAEMTAKWEAYLKKIGHREGSVENFIKNIQKFILHLIDKVPDDISALDTKNYEEQKLKEEEKNIVGQCPNCKGNIVAKKSFYGCSNYPDCKFTLSDNFRKKKLTKGNIKDLLEGNETLVKNIKNANKQTYNAIVKLNDKGYIDFVSFEK